MDTFYNEEQLIENEKGWLFYDAAFKCWKEINRNLEGVKILDVGCGTGITLGLSKLFNPNLEAQGIEGDQAAATLASKRGIGISNMSIYNMDFPSNTFDTVYTSHVLEHLDDPKLVIDECFRVSTKRCIHVVPDGNVNSKNFGSPHIHIFNRKNFLELFKEYSENIIDFYSIQDYHMNSLIIIIDK